MVMATYKWAKNLNLLRIGGETPKGSEALEEMLKTTDTQINKNDNEILLQLLYQKTLEKVG